MKAHEQEFSVLNGGAPEWEYRDDGSCSYCGSISTSKAIQLLNTTGTFYSGSDWKYGWPHKLYIHAKESFGKFYTTHLMDETSYQLEEFNNLSIPLLGLDFKIGEKGIKFLAPGQSWQTWGTIGMVRNGDQVDANFGPRVPDWFIKRCQEIREKAVKA